MRTLRKGSESTVNIFEQKQRNRTQADAEAVGFHSVKDREDWERSRESKGWRMKGHWAVIRVLLPPR